MASIQKLTVTRWVDAAGKQVKPHTPGARKVQEESAKWYACWREGKKQVRIPLATDKEVAQVMLGDLIRQRERGEANMVDPHKDHLDAPLADHIADYLIPLSERSCTEHQQEVERLLRHFAVESGMKRLRDVNADKVAVYLSSLRSSPQMRNKHRTAIVGFLNWCEAVRRIPHNPVTPRSVRPAKVKFKRRERRALIEEEIAKVLIAARDYPVKSASVNRGGRGAKKKPRASPCKLRAETLAKLQLRGRERHLLYRLAVLTGLRRIELARLRVAHLDLDRQPFASLLMPGHLTKNGKPAVLFLVPSLAADLRQWVKDTGKKPTDAVVTVPCRHNLIRLHKRHLKMAGISYLDAEGRRADFHALRLSVNVLLRRAGIPAKERQLFMRHATQALTTDVYDDVNMTSVGDIVKVLEATNL